MVERLGVFDSFSRSRDLVRGNGWNVFGVVLVTVILTAVVVNVIQRVAFSVSDDFAGAAVGSLVGQLLTAPVFALAVSVLFFQLRGLR